MSLGSNLGDSERILRTALQRLAPLFDELRVGSLYRSLPLSPHSQPPFLNTAAAGPTTLDPDAILACAKELERLAGRRPGRRWGPRPLDIDLLLHGQAVLRSPELTLPHPRLASRRFALAPLADVAPQLRVPPEGATVAELLERLGPAAGADEAVDVGWSGGECHPP